MFDILFGWRKASKCKKLIKRAQCRLKLLKNKRGSIVRQLRDDVGQLLKTGHEQIAFDRVEQLIKDESIMAVYEMLDNFCEFIIINHSYIRKHKDCPNDIKEAVSSLIFASARCGNLPELRGIRKLFGQRYGQRLETAALELLPGNLVNCQVKEKLSIKFIPDDMKHRLIDEIAWDYSLYSGPLAIEYSSELQRQQLQAKDDARELVPDRNVQINDGRCIGSQVQASNVQETELEVIHVDTTMNTRKFVSEPCHSFQNYSITTSNNSPIMAESQMQKKAKRVENHAHMESPHEFTVSGPDTESWSVDRTHADCLEDKLQTTAAAYSSESPPQFPEETVVYLDNVAEFQSPFTEDGNSYDQRVFKFESSVLPKRTKNEDCRNGSYMNIYESWNEIATPRKSRKSHRGGKRLRKRSVSRENPSLKDVEYAVYYGGSLWNPPNHKHKSHQRRHRKVNSIEESQQFDSAQTGSKRTQFLQKGSKFKSRECKYHSAKSCCRFSSYYEKVNNCSLEHPCYFGTRDDKDNWEIPLQRQKISITKSAEFSVCVLEQGKDHVCHCSGFQEMKRASLPGMPIPNYVTRNVMDAFEATPDHQANKNCKRMEVKLKDSKNAGGCASSTSSCSRVTSPSTGKQAQPPYLRAMTMPPPSPSKDCWTDNILRSNSFPYQNLNSLKSSGHVHPKLPDYDEVAAKFTALRKAYLQINHH